MEEPAGSSLADFLSSAIIERSDDAAFIRVPGRTYESLSELERTALINEVDRQITSDQLLAALRDITPPVDEEEDRLEALRLEADARDKLELEGCPPCYPPDPDFSLFEPPEEYRPVITYWQSLGGGNDVVLCAQLGDWETFRRSQSRIRLRYQRGNHFANFVGRVRDRRRRYALDDNVNLLCDLEKQSRLENWVEFQDYHILRHDRLQKELQEDNEALENYLRKADDAHTKASSGRAGAFVYRSNAEFAKRNLDHHEHLLQWIEQRRKEMEIGRTRRSKRNITKPLRTESTRDQPKRQHTAAHDRNRVSKAKPKTKVTRTNRFTKPQTTKPRQAQSSGGTGVKPAAMQEYKTRSGRISRPPVRWTPE